MACLRYFRGLGQSQRASGCALRASVSPLRTGATSAAVAVLTRGVVLACSGSVAKCVVEEAHVAASGFHAAEALPARTTSSSRSPKGKNDSSRAITTQFQTLDTTHPSQATESEDATNGNGKGLFLRFR